MNAAAEAALAREVKGPIPRMAVPRAPTLIRPLAHKPLQADTLDDLARHLHRLRGDRALQIGPLLVATYGGSDTFPGFNLTLIDALTSDEEWIGFAAVQSDRADGLKAALSRTEPRRDAA